MSTPTKNAIIGQFVNGRNSQDDFLQLANNHGGTVFAWIDYQGILQGTFAPPAPTPTNPGGANTDVQYNNNGVFGGTSQFTWGDGTNALGLFQGQPASGLSANLAPVFAGFSPAQTAVIGHTSSGLAVGLFVASQGDADGNVFGMEVAADATHLPSSIFVGAEVDGYYSVPMGFTNPNIQTGFEGSVLAYGAGNSGGQASFFGYTQNSGAGIVTLAANFYSSFNANSGAGSIVTSTGYYAQDLQGVGTSLNAAFYAEAQTSGANNYAFYSVGANNYFGGGAANSTKLINTAAATNILNQHSPYLQLTGQVWSTTGGAHSETTVFYIQNKDGGLQFGQTSGVSPLQYPIIFNTQVQFNNSILLGQANFAFGTGNGGAVFVLTAAGNASAGLTTYACNTIVPAGNPVAGQNITIAGFSTGANNGNFVVQSSTANTIVVYNAGGVSETHAGTATLDTNYDPSIGQYALQAGVTGAATFPITGTSHFPNNVFNQYPNDPAFVINVKGDNLDAAYLRIVNDGATGNHGLEIGGIVDGTGAAPVTLQLGHFNGASTAVLNVPLTVKGTAPTGGASQLSLGSTTATSASTGANGDVPAQVVGYLIFDLSGTKIKVPYYAT